MFQIPTALASNFGMLLAFRFLTGLFGSPPPSNWRRYHCGHVSTTKASVWTMRLGYRSGLRPCPWTSGWWLCSRSQGLDVDYLGDHVAFRLLLGVSVLLPPGDEFDKYLIPTHEAAA